MIRCNHHAVEVSQTVERHIRDGDAAMVEVGDVSVVVGHLSAPPPEKLNYVERRGLPDVINVALVSNPAHENLRALHRPAPVVERIGHLDRNEFGHGRVDLVGELDEARVVFQGLELPRKVQRIDRNAVPAQTGAGIEGHETEWLAGRGVDDLPGIQSKAAAHHGDLVDQADVDRAEGVLQQLDHLRRVG